MKKLPKYFIVRRDSSDEYRQFISWLNQTYGKDWHGSGFKYYGYDGTEKYMGTNCYDNIGSFKNQPTLFTAQEIMSIINNKETMKQIGWKLKDECKIYKQVAKDICKVTVFNEKDNNFSVRSESESKLKKAGVLELWFEPVYKEQFQVGDWVKIVNIEGRCQGKIGEVFKIESIQANSFYNKDILGKFFEANNLTFATEEEILKATTPIKIGGYEVKCIRHDVCIINGTSYTKSELLALINIMEKGQVKSLNVGCQGQYTVDLEMIKKILNKIK